MSRSFEKAIVCPILVGRASYLDALSQHLDDAKNGHGQTLLLGGEAGIGKSSLVAESKGWAQQNGFLILQGNCFEPDRVLPYAPMLDLLRGFIATYSAEPLRTLASELIKLIPELAVLLPDITPLPFLQPAQEKQRLFQTLDELLTRKTAGTLVIVEDLHWCDDTSLDFLLYFARHVSKSPILLLLTYRNDEPNPSLRHFLAVLDHDRLANEMTINHLSRADVDLMITAIFEQGTRIKPEFAETIYSLTDGNPFFVEETLKALMVSGDINYEMGGWTRGPMNELRIPRSVQDAVQRRIEGLSEKTKQVLSLAAVAGRRFDFDLLQRLTQSTENELVKSVKELISVQLMVEESTDHFLFRHELTRQAIYSHLLGRERRNLHRAIAVALEARLVENNAPYILDGVLSYHCFEAGLWEKAFDYSRRASDHAQALYTPRAAIEQLSRAIIASQYLSVELPLGLYRSRGQQYETLGEFDAAQNDFQTMLEEARTRSDRHMEWQALIDLGFLWAARDYTQTGNYFQQALSLAHRLDDSAALAHNLNRVGNWHLNIDQAREALRYHHEALRIFEKLQDRRGLASTHDLLGITYYSSNDVYQGLAHYEQAIGLFRELNDRGGLASSLVIAASRGCEYIGSTAVPMRVSLAERLNRLQEALIIARETESKPAEVITTMWLGMNLNSSGDYSGFAHLREGLELAEVIDHKHFRAVAHMILGMSYLDVLAPMLAREHLERALDQARATNSIIWIGMMSAYLALAYIQLNDLVRAETTLETAHQTDALMDTMGSCHLWAARTRLLLASGQADKALQTIERLISSLPNIEKEGEYSNPRLSQLRGEILITLRRYATAEKVLRDTLVASQTLELRPREWRIWACLSQSYRAQGKLDLADEAAIKASQIVEELADTLDDSDLQKAFRVRAVSQWRGKTLFSQHELIRHQFDGLTSREREIAALIAQGKANKEIAEALVLSNRTVESHIGRILSKLNFTSRAQIAVWAVEKGLLKT